MGLLSKKQIAEYALRTGHVYVYVCDEREDCGQLIRPGDLYVVLKWEKRKDGLQSIMGRIPVKVRCMSCERFLHPPKEIVKVKNAGRTAKKVSAEIAAEIQIDVKLRRCVLSLLKANPEGIPVKQFVLKLRKKKIVREMTAKVVRATLKGMKKLKMFRRSKGMVLLPKEKKVKKRKDKAHAC
jgi:hypothetical protein